MNSKSVNRRLALAFAMVLLPSLSMLANANEKFPERPITIVVPAAPGGGSDASARIIAKYLTEKLGQSVAVLNRPGAAGIVAMNYVKGVAADGYVAHYSTGFILANHLIGLSKESWEEMLRPVAITGDLTNSVIVARKEVPINTFKELKERKDLSLVFAVEAGTVAEGLAVAINNETGGRRNIVPFGSFGWTCGSCNGDSFNCKRSSAIRKAQAYCRRSRQAAKSKAGSLHIERARNQHRNELVPLDWIAKEYSGCGGGEILDRAGSGHEGPQTRQGL